MLDELLDEKGIVGLALKDSNFISILVLVILLLMSSLSWAVIVLKALQFRKANKQNQEFLLIFRKETSLNQIKESIPKFPFSTFAPMYRLAFEEMVRISQRIQRNSDQTVSGSMLPYISTQFERVMERAFNDQYALIEKRLNVLATISSAAPFIGLFGTVLGIIRSFQNIGTSGVTSLAAVAPGISEALIATAAGLLAAIPALMAYNHFRNSARKQANDMRDFSMELANRIEWIVHGQLTVARE